MIKYKNNNYPSRTFMVELEGDTQEIMISVHSLSNAMGIKKEENNTEEQDIDDDIYFYVLDREIENDAKDICENHLDIPMKFLHIVD